MMGMRIPQTPTNHKGITIGMMYTMMNDLYVRYVRSPFVGSGRQSRNFGG
jgi:hypothetical protein